jgi:hypothetical protein
MFNVIKFTDKDGNVDHLATNKSVSYFRPDTNPELVAIEIEDISKAFELANYFDREINDIWDKLQKPPFFYKEPRSNNIPLHVQFEKQKSNPITPSANMEDFDY